MNFIEPYERDIERLVIIDVKDKAMKLNSARMQSEIGRLYPWRYDIQTKQHIESYIDSFLRRITSGIMRQISGTNGEETCTVNENDERRTENNDVRNRNARKTTQGCLPNSKMDCYGGSQTGIERKWGNGTNNPTN